MEEPEEMVGDNQQARGKEDKGCEGDNRPCVRKVLQVDHMAENGKESLLER